MTNDKDSAVTQADIDAAKLYLQGTGPWALDEIGIGPDDSLVQAFARHRLEERAKIVAWCRNVNIYWCKCDYAIEEGEHLQEQSK